MALGIQAFVQLVLFGARRIVGDDRRGGFVGNGGSDSVAVLRRVDHDHIRSQTFDKRHGLWRVTAISAGQDEAHRATHPFTAVCILVLRQPRERPRA